MNLHDGKMRIGILGGTFNPIHMGHLILAEQARCEFGLDKVIFIPAYDPPHKSGDGLLPFSHRFEMVKLATKDNEAFEVSDIEERLLCKSYTINTIKTIINENPENASMYYFVGSDQVMVLETWKSYEALLELCNFVAVVRPGYDAEALSEKVQSIKLITGSEIYELEICGMDISSSVIRSRVYEGKSVRYLVPDAVEMYIREHGLYSE